MIEVEESVSQYEEMRKRANVLERAEALAKKSQDAFVLWKEAEKEARGKRKIYENLLSEMQSTIVHWREGSQLELNFDRDAESSHPISDIAIGASMRRKLAAAGVDTIEKVGDLLAGENQEFPQGPQQINGFDRSMVSELKAAYLAWLHDDSQGDVAENEGEAPLPAESDLSLPVDLEKMDYRVTVQSDLCPVPVGEIVSGTESGGVVHFRLPDGTEGLLNPGEYEVLS